MDEKFKAYLKMHFRMIPGYSYIVAVIMGITMAFLVEYINRKNGVTAGNAGIFGIEILTIVIMGILIPYIDKICSVTIYQKEAYFYMSFPVNVFQIVLAKTIVTGAVIVMIPAGYIFTIMILNRQYNLASVLGMIFICLALDFAVTETVITGYRIGNNFRNRKKSRPNKIVAGVFVIAILILLFIIYHNVFKNGNSDREFKLFAMAGILIAAGITGFAVNVVSIKKYYEV